MVWRQSWGSGSGKHCNGGHTIEICTMSSAIDSVIAKIRNMPPDLQKDVIEYIHQLEQRSNRTHTQKFRFEWEGSLAHLKDQYTSVQLQHKVLDWWD